MDNTLGWLYVRLSSILTGGSMDVKGICATRPYLGAPPVPLSCIIARTDVTTSCPLQIRKHTYCGHIPIWSPASVQHSHAPVRCSAVDSDLDYSEGASTTNEDVASSISLTRKWPFGPNKGIHILRIVDFSSDCYTKAQKAGATNKRSQKPHSWVGLRKKCCSPQQRRGIISKYV